jgi:hypothetical protein
MNKLHSILAVHGSAFEDMSFASIKILNGWDGLEKYVYQCIPVLLEMD